MLLNSERETDQKLIWPKLSSGTNMPKRDLITTIKLDGLIGKGGYGTVYRCMDDVGTHMAVKCIDCGTDGIPFLMETIIMSSIDHPNLNRAIKIHPTSSKLYIVQELAQSDLQRWRRKHTPTTQQLRGWIHDLLQAVSCLHRLHIIHGDIKASNVLLYSDETIKLSDFTLSTRKGYPTNYVACTCTHRPLEVWLGRIWDESIDIWALGCTIFELVYGYSLFPYQGDDDTPVIPRRDKLRDQFINALLDWSKFEEDSTRFNIPYRDVKYHPFVLPDHFDPALELNQLILSMLKLDTSMRPTASELLNHPYFDGLSVSSWRIISTSINNLTGRSETKARSLINLYLKNMIHQDDVMISELTYELYTRLTGLINVSDSLKVQTCIWIAYKLIHRIAITSTSLLIPIHEIMKMERVICSHLGFRLLILSPTEEHEV